MKLKRSSSQVYNDDTHFLVDDYETSCQLRFFGWSAEVIARMLIVTYSSFLYFWRNKNWSRTLTNFWTPLMRLWHNFGLSYFAQWADQSIKQIHSRIGGCCKWQKQHCTKHCFFFFWTDKIRYMKKDMKDCWWILSIINKSENSKVTDNTWMLWQAA